MTTRSLKCLSTLEAASCCQPCFFHVGSLSSGSRETQFVTSRVSCFTVARWRSQHASATTMRKPFCATVAIIWRSGHAARSVESPNADVSPLVVVCVSQQQATVKPQDVMRVPKSGTCHEVSLAGETVQAEVHCGECPGSNRGSAHACLFVGDHRHAHFFLALVSLLFQCARQSCVLGSVSCVRSRVVSNHSQCWQDAGFCKVQFWGSTSERHSCKEAPQAV